MDTGNALTIAAVAFGATTHAVTGLGFSIVCVPALTVVYGGRDGVRLSNLLALGVNVLVLGREGRHADFRRAFSLLVPAAIAAPLTGVAIRYADADLLSIISGVVVLATVVALAVGARAPGFAGPLGAIVAGSASGAMNVVAGIGGPTVAGYANNAQWPPDRLRPTLATYFLGLNAISVAVRGAPDISSGLLIGCAAALVVGYAAGVVLRGRIDARHLQLGTLLLAGCGAIAAIVKGFT
ncbi:MAG: TSUP family transporter [Acidimicrobiales bacterium]